MLLKIPFGSFPVELAPHICNFFHSVIIIHWRKSRRLWYCHHQAHDLNVHAAVQSVERCAYSEIISSISDMKFSRDGRYIMSRDYMTVKLWDINMEAKPVAVFPVHDHVRSKVNGRALWWVCLPKCPWLETFCPSSCALDSQAKLQLFLRVWVFRFSKCSRLQAYRAMMSLTECSDRIWRLLVCHKTPVNSLTWRPEEWKAMSLTSKIA